MTYLDFILNNLGHRLTAAGGLGGQCVDGVNVYLHDVFATGPIYANAVDWVHAALPGWAWVPNGPTNFPPYGAIVVWGPAPQVGVSVFGHVAVALRADAQVLLSVDQHWPEGAPLSVVAHTYPGVRGWWVPPHSP